MKVEKYTTEELYELMDDARNKIKSLEDDIVKYHSAMFLLYSMSQLKAYEKKLQIIYDEIYRREITITKS